MNGSIFDSNHIARIVKKKLRVERIRSETSDPVSPKSTGAFMSTLRASTSHLHPPLSLDSRRVRLDEFLQLPLPKPQIFVTFQIATLKLTCVAINPISTILPSTRFYTRSLPISPLSASNFPHTSRNVHHAYHNTDACLLQLLSLLHRQNICALRTNPLTRPLVNHWTRESNLWTETETAFTTALPQLSRSTRSSGEH